MKYQPTIIGASVTYVDADKNTSRILNFPDAQARDTFKIELWQLLDKYSKKIEHKDGIPF